MAVSSSTKLFAITLEQVLAAGGLDRLADVFKKIALDRILTPRKIVFTGLTASTTHNITDAAHAAGATGVTVSPAYPSAGPAQRPGVPASLQFLLPIYAVVALRTTAQGAGTPGPYLV